MYIIGRGPPRASFVVMNMISLTYILVLVFCAAAAAAASVEQVQEEVTTLPPATEEVARRELTDAGYVIRYGDSLYRYPLRIVPLVRRIQPEERNPTETNEIETDGDKGRPLFYFTTYEASNSSDSRGLPASGPYIEIRRKRDVEAADVPESSKVAKLRRKRTYCGKCGGGGYGGYYIPVTYAVYPVYTAYPVYSGGYGGKGKGKGCHTCGGGGGGGGSYSYSSSSAQSSSGSYSWGKK